MVTWLFFYFKLSTKTEISKSILIPTQKYKIPKVQNVLDFFIFSQKSKLLKTQDDFKTLIF